LKWPNFAVSWMLGGVAHFSGHPTHEVRSIWDGRTSEIPLPRTPVNKGRERKGRSCCTPTFLRAPGAPARLRLNFRSTLWVGVARQEDVGAVVVELRPDVGEGVA
jgi:hypothetical protein